MEMILIGGKIVDGLESNISSNEVREMIKINLSDYKMKKVTVYFDRSGQSIKSSLIILPDGKQIRVLGDVRKNTNVVVRPLGYKL